MQLRRLHTDYWEERADKVLSHFQYQFPDEIDIYQICWRYGIRILPLDVPLLADYADLQSLESLQAFSIAKDKAKRGTIFIKEGLNEIEKKLLIAEEFCHLYAHHSHQLSTDKYMVAKNECQVKRMASYLLMPERFICDIYSSALDEAVLISDIADHFLVSEEFAHYRLELIFNHRVDAVMAHRGRLGTVEWFSN